jgi:hypothetical protein
MRVDWYWLVVTFTWVFGCALVLSVLSIVYAQASFKNTSFLKQLNQLKPMLWLLIGSIVALIGVCFTGVPIHQKLFWCATVLWISVETFLVWRKQWQKQFHQKQ